MATLHLHWLMIRESQASHACASVCNPCIGCFYSKTCAVPARENSDFTAFSGRISAFLVSVFDINASTKSPPIAAALRL
ncbi:hypothetical protein DENSPDRAFT_838995 [Dentipellis sp. KUC8613]|nr:hypothetical protein DENSPDRAFT_838995 [Dentipellis sp. KUC8613]